MNLPTSVVVLIVIILMVLIAVVAFFFSTSGAKISEAEADRIFAEQCLELCDKASEGGVEFLMTLENTNSRFLDACQVKYSERAPNVCLGFCGDGCSIKASLQEQLCLKAKAIPDSREHCMRLQERPEYKQAGVSCEQCDFS